MSASIRLNGNPTPLQELAGNLVTLTNFDNTGILAWQWTLLDRPAGSLASLTGAASSVATLTPDVPGSYLVRLRTWLDAGATVLDGVSTAIAFVRYTTVPTWRVPAAGETTEVNATRGWADEVNDIIDYIQSNIGAGGSVGTKYWLESTDAIVVPSRFQYLVKTALLVDPGGSIVADPGGQIVVIP